MFICKHLLVVITYTAITISARVNQGGQMQIRNFSILSFITLFFLIGCGNGDHMSFPGLGSGSSDNSADKPDGNSAINYIENIQPLFERRCSLCHNGGSTIPNWLVYEVAHNAKDLIRFRVFISKDMPLSNATGMTEDERALVALWVDSGAPRGPANPTPQPPNPSPNPEPEPEPPAPTPAPPEEDPITFKNQIFPIIQSRSCASCHTGFGAPMGLRLDNLETAFNALMQNSQQKPGVKRVQPNDPSPSSSYFVAKIIEEGDFRSGGRMPANGNWLSADEILLIQNWIRSGAEK